MIDVSRQVTFDVKSFLVNWNFGGKYRFIQMDVSLNKKDPSSSRTALSKEDLLFEITLPSRKADLDLTLTLLVDEISTGNLLSDFQKLFKRDSNNMPFVDTKLVPTL